MSPASVLSSSANLVSAAATLINMDNNSKPPNQQTVQIPITKLSPVFIELNGTLVNLRDISLIRKANNKSKCFVIYLKQGMRCETKHYAYQVDFLQDYDQVLAILDSVVSNPKSSDQLNAQTPISELPSVFMELNGTLVDLRDISLICKDIDNSKRFVIYLKQGIHCQTEYYAYERNFLLDYVRLIAELSTL